MTASFTIFATAVGWCGVAWGEQGITAVQLPEAGEGATRRRLRRHVPDGDEVAPPPDVQRVIDRIVALLDGKDADLSTLELDMAGVPEFERRVYEQAREIPRGETRTYGDIATAIGEPGSARAVGQALSRNPFPIVVPCHRVVAAGGRIGGFSARGGSATKRRLLSIEGAATPTLWDEPA